MPVKVGCASDYNKIHSDRIQKKRDEEAIVLVANNKRYGWVDFDEHITELAPGIALYETQRKHWCRIYFCFLSFTKSIKPHHVVRLIRSSCLNKVLSYC